MPEFIEHPPCGRPVETKTGKLVGFCTRRIEHKPGCCSHLINDRTTHNIREE